MVNSPPRSSWPESQSPASDVTVWWWKPLLTQRTVVPAGTTTIGGEDRFSQHPESFVAAGRAEEGSGAPYARPLRAEAERPALRPRGEAPAGAASGEQLGWPHSPRWRAPGELNPSRPTEAAPNTNTKGSTRMASLLR